MPSNTLLNTVLPQLHHIHMLLEMEPVNSMVVTITSVVSQRLLLVTVTPSSPPSVVDHSPLPLMPLTGHSITVVFSTIVLPTLTTVSY